MRTIIPIFDDNYEEENPRAIPKRIINEHEIILASQKDPVCFKPIYEYYYRAILNYINQRVDDLPVAEDLTSNTFFKSLLNIGKYKKTEVPFSAWLYKIAYNETMQYFRKSKKRQNVVLDETLMGNLADDVTSNNRPELIQATIQAIETLDRSDVELIDLKYYQQKSLREIAFILNISESNAKVRSHRLIKKIKTRLKENYGKI